MLADAVLPTHFKVNHDTMHTLRKNADRIEEQELPMIDTPEGDVLEIDEICIRKSLTQWLWIKRSFIRDSCIALYSTGFGLRTRRP